MPVSIKQLIYLSINQLYKLNTTTSLVQSVTFAVIAKTAFYIQGTCIVR